MMPNVFIFIGRSGCGKGTQSGLLRKYLSEKNNREIVYIETGVEFRKFIERDSYTNKLSKKVYEQGKRQPDFLASFMWTEALIERFSGKEHLFLDGAPRSLLEAQSFETAVHFYNLTKPIVVFMDVSREWSKERLTERGRADDLKKEKIDKRLNWFETDVSPAIAFMKNSSAYNLIRVNGEQTIEEVHAEIVNAVLPHLGLGDDNL
jgi:adenylate kinase family enzyme